MCRRYDHASRPVFDVVVACCLLVVVVQLSCVVVVSGLYLQGSRTSYVRLPRWHSCPNSSLTLEFRTSLTDALLAYSDDGGRSSFMVLAIDNGSVSARISVVSDELDVGADHASTTLRVASRPISDRHWHKASV